MAKSDGQTLEKLYIELGLDLSQLQADILAADKTVTENLGRLNREKNIIKLRMEADIAGLDRAKDAAKILEIQQAALNQQLALSKDRMRILEAAYQQVANNANSTAVAVQNAEKAFLREKIAVGQLEQQLRELASQKASSTPTPLTGLLGGYQGLKGNITGVLSDLTSAFGQLQGATSSADSALVASLGIIDGIPHPVGKAAAALATLPILFRGIENSIVDMTRAAAASGDATYVMSRGFQMSLKDTGTFVTNAKTAGVEVMDLANSVKRVQQQIVKGGDDGRAAKELKRYGESARDANGNLKNLNEMTFALSRALHKAQDEGRGMEFVLSVFRNVSADAITAIEDWEAVNAQAATTVKNGLADPALAHEVQGNLNQMNDQAAKMHATFTSALLPVANEIIPRVTERMGKLTQVIADNKDVIKGFGRDVGEIFLSLESGAEKVISVFGTVGKFLYDLKKRPGQNELVERFKTDTGIKSIDDLIKRAQPKSYEVIKADPRLYAQVKAQYQPIYQAISDAQEEIKRKQKELAKILANSPSIADFSTAGQERNRIEDNIDTLRKARKYLDEADSISFKMNHGDYQNALYDLEQWRTELLRETERTEQEREAIEKLYAAKRAQIQKEYNEKIQQYFKDAADIEYSLTHTAYEKQIRDIEQWKEAQLKKAETAEEVAGIIKNAAAKEAEAFEREVDRIKGVTQSLEDEIFEMEHSQYEVDKRRALQKAQKALDEGVDFATVQRYLDDKFGQLNTRAAKGGDYTKSPDGAMQRGGNGIMVIGGDQIIDDGKLNQSIGLITDENKIRAQLLPTLSAEGRERAAAIAANKKLADAQQNLAQQASQGFQVINGDQPAAPIIPQMPQSAGGIQIIEGDQIVSGLKEFGGALQQTSAELAQFAPLESLETNLPTLGEVAQTAAEAHKSLAERLNDFSPDYFKQLADGTKAVSDMQLSLTESTMKLIDAQSKLADVLTNLPTSNPQRETNQQLPTDGMMNLSYSTQNLQDAQSKLAVTTRDVDSRLQDISDIPRQKDSGLKLGFDYDTAKDIFLTGAGMAAITGSTGVGLAFTPEILAGAIVAALGGGLAKGSYDATTATSDDRLQPLAGIDLSGIITPLTSIDGNVQSVLQELQSQATSETTMTLETVITPLNNIEGLVQNILSALANSQPPTITVSLSISNNLGGAYVFDNALKKALVDDITGQVVSSITSAVKQATSQSNYSYGA